MTEAFLAVHRFGLGARPGDLAAGSSVLGDPRGWLLSQLDPGLPAPAALRGLPDAESLLAEHGRVAESEQQRRERRELYVREVTARTRAAIASDHPLRERLVRFLGNVFTVSTTQPRCVALVGAFEREAIRPHAVGPFGALLRASSQHPAMLLYLDNQRSTGPGSTAGYRGKHGRNENLAREILELHTLGSDGGYTQQDVIALANMLTGWRVYEESGDPGQVRGPRGFAFSPRHHEPGPQTLLGRFYPDAGQSQGELALADLAAHPATARRFAWRLAREFLADDPPEPAVAELEAAFRESEGDLGHTAAALVTCDAAWDPRLSKLRTPEELVIATCRALELQPDDEALQQAFQALGQAPFAAPSPEGWPEEAAAWLGGEALLRRLSWAQRAGEQAAQRGLDPAATAAAALGPMPDETLVQLMRGAPDRATALALLVASPPFQRR